MRQNTSRWLAAGSLLTIILIFCAWRAGNEGFQNRDTPAQDTTPIKKHIWKKDIRGGELDDALQDIDRAMQKMDKELRIDLGNMELDIKKAMKEIGRIDVEKINREIAASLKEIDWSRTRRDVDRAMLEAENSLRKVDMKEIGRSVQKALANVQAEKTIAGVNTELIRKSVEAGLSGVRTGLEALRKELSLLKEFVDELEKDKLIDTKKGYLIEIRSGELYLNGTRQPKEVNDKYRKYFTKENLTISDDGEDSIRI